MSKTKNTVSFNGTAEQKEELLKVIAEKKNDKGALMPILQKAQDIYGYLPIEVQTIFRWKKFMALLHSILSFH